MLVGLEKSLLQDVLGVLVVLGNVLGEAVNLAFVLIHQVCKGLCVTRLCLGDEQSFIEYQRRRGWSKRHLNPIYQAGRTGRAWQNGRLFWFGRVRFDHQRAGPEGTPQPE